MRERRPTAIKWRWLFCHLRTATNSDILFSLCFFWRIHLVLKCWKNTVPQWSLLLVYLNSFCDAFLPFNFGYLYQKRKLRLTLRMSCKTLKILFGNSESWVSGIRLSFIYSSQWTISSDSLVIPVACIIVLALASLSKCLHSESSQK